MDNVTDQLTFEAIRNLVGIDEFHEDSAIEIKFGLGESGNKGELPRSFFDTYSSFANTHGGIILLGFHEISDGVYEYVGFRNTDHVIKQLWTSLNNKNKVSVNLLSEKNVKVLEYLGKKFIKITIDPASRKQKPVYIDGNPYTGTFRRDFDGDQHCDEEKIKRMISEQVEDSLDYRVLENYNIDDLNKETIKGYRIKFSLVKPASDWNLKSDQEFLRLIGAINIDRSTKKIGVTVAGLLMFGQFNSITDEFPNYFLDYQEKSFEDSEKRWIDRVSTDGTWTGNLFDFYNIVLQKLYQNVKVPFNFSGTTRIDNSPIHVALREALTNTLIHADYKGRSSILIIKRPDTFCFYNPGSMRVPILEAIRGGNTDCRNKKLQTMFSLMGRGDRAGSGIPQIFKNWTDQLWRTPILREKYTPDQTILQLDMINLMPDDVLQKLRHRFEGFDGLNNVKKIALVFASLDGSVNHARLREISRIHRHDLSKALRELVDDGYLEPHGATTGRIYFLPAMTVQATLDGSFKNAKSSAESSVHLGKSFVHLDESSVHLELVQIAKRVSETKGAPKEEVEYTILKLCNNRYLTVNEIANLLKREPSTVRTHYINGMVSNGYLKIRFPTRSHPKQAYTTAKKRKGDKTEK
jgi:predicted HTH transcriptional regulator